MFQRLLPFRFLILLALTCCIQSKSFAQPNLPDMVSVTQNGINILTWTCQYDGVKTIAVQRSSDSNFNYTTIGYVRDIKKGVQYYLDGHPKPGANWYRVKLVFGSDLSWTSNRIKVMVDSAQIAKARSLPPNDSLQGLIAKSHVKTVEVAATAVNTTVKPKVEQPQTPTPTPTRTLSDTVAATPIDRNLPTRGLQQAPKVTMPVAANAQPISKLAGNTLADSMSEPTFYNPKNLPTKGLQSMPTKTLPVTTTTIPVPAIEVPPAPIVVKPLISLEIPDIESVDAYSYIKSQYVFTNPFTGHVNIEVADAKTSKYSIEFFDCKNAKILEIPKLNETNIVLDKRNFQRVGIYKFELYKDKVKLETGYVTIY
jgi:hypothetical protein